MKTSTKKRLDIVIEAPVLDRLIDILDAQEVPGWTVTPAVGGRGRTGRWDREGQIGAAGRMLAVFAIMDEQLVDRVLTAVYGLLSRQIGIVTVSDVQVIRADHF